MRGILNLVLILKMNLRIELLKILYLTLGKRHYPFTFNEYETIESLFFNDFNRDKKNSFIKSNSKLSRRICINQVFGDLTVLLNVDQHGTQLFCLEQT